MKFFSTPFPWRRVVILLLMMASCVVSACSPLVQVPHSRWKVINDHGVSWLLTPGGERFFSLGVNVLNTGYPERLFNGRLSYHGGAFYHDQAAWARAARQRVTAWGFNTAGAWSLHPDELMLPVIPDLELGRAARFHWFDPFDPSALETARSWAEKLVAPYKGNPYRIGYFLDNEVGWWNGALFIWYSKQPETNHTKQRLVALLRDHYGNDWGEFDRDFLPPPGVASFEDLLRTEGLITRLRPGGAGIRVIRRFTGIVAEQYYRLLQAALREADPEALIFSDRLPIYYDPDAARAMAPYVDVIATNYDIDTPDGWVARYYFDGLRQLTGDKPVLISEWFFAAHENSTGNLNKGQLMTVQTQAQRARGATAAARRLAGDPWIVGMHWFQYYDHPRGGRPDGEDYNFGLVDIHDRPYEEITAAFSRVNPALAGIHEQGRPFSPAAHSEESVESQKSTVSATPPDPGSAPESGRRPGESREPEKRRTPVFTSLTASREAADTGRYEVPEAAIQLDDRSLGEWPKDAAFVPGLVAQQADVVFGDLYLAWNREGLYLATISMDYYDPLLLAYGDAFPLEEAFRIEWGVDAGAGPHRFNLLFVPQRSLATDDDPLIRVQLCEVDDAGCRPIPSAAVSHVGEGIPRLTAEAFIPWNAMGVVGPPPDGTLRLELAARSFYRSRWMSWSGLAPETGLHQPARWRVVKLGRTAP